MPSITSITQPIINCFQSHYSLPTFQREYKWERKHFLELLNDIQEAFLDSYLPSHGRTDVASYQPYFVGSIITSELVLGKKPVIDGQQRLTSLFIMLAYFHKYVTTNSIPDVADIKPLLGSLNYGRIDYRIEFSQSRKSLFDNYLNSEKTHEQAINEFEGTTFSDEATHELWNCWEL